MTIRVTSGKEKRSASTAPKKPRSVRAERERILVEFPVGLLERADETAAELEKSRSELIRSAVEQMLAEREKKRFEAELADAYAANAERNVGLVEEFVHVDREGF
jgi:metal-responsive CopG/Arc/MetJ family transcriptional regulator